MVVNIVLDSVNPAGIRLTTFALTYPRFIHAQMMTHRVFSRSVASSRAIPIERMIAEVENNLVMPSYWGKLQKGMVAEQELLPQEIEQAKLAWINAARNATDSARRMLEIGLHKEYANRLLEPFTHVHAVLSGTDFDNFFMLRIDKHAQPEIYNLASAMKEAMDNSKPRQAVARDWHIPFVDDEFLITRYTQDALMISTENQALISAARCARISYGAVVKKDTYAELALAESLVKNQHLSPFEHQALAMNSTEKVGNFRGWIQQRFLI